MPSITFWVNNMPIFLAFVGILLIVAGVKGQEQALLQQMSGDVKAFVVWFVIILLVGAVGLSKTMRPLSNAFIVLIFVAFIIRDGNQIIAGAKQITGGSAK
jgi:hypothetical protein